MGIRTLNWDEWIEMDKNFIHYHDVKVSELNKCIDDHVQFVDNEKTRAACYEVYEEIVKFLARRYPDIFSIKGNHVHNALTGEAFSLTRSKRILQFFGSLL
jgi:hypothetical protein